jgi:hypothetical protein
MTIWNSLAIAKIPANVTMTQGTRLIRWAQQGHRDRDTTVVRTTVAAGMSRVDAGPVALLGDEDCMEAKPLDKLPQVRRQCWHLTLM